MTRQLQKRFEKIKKAYFPRWDRQHIWRIRLDSTLPGGGRCERECKKLLIKSLSEPVNLLVNSLDELLIHEICHAVVGNGHGKKFQRRMLLAAERAKDLGNCVLADEIRHEVEETQRSIASGLGGKEHAYQWINDRVVCDSMTSWKSVRWAVANEWELRPSQVLHEFPKARTVFDEAIRTLREMQRAEARFGQGGANGGSSDTC